MPSTFLGLSGGGGGGGSSFFLGTTYGPTSFCGPPASGGASCWFGLAGGCCCGGCCCGVSWACAGRVATTVQQRTNASRIRRLREADGARYKPPRTLQIMGKPRKLLC